MAKLNEKRVVLGGVAAGLVLLAGSLVIRWASGYEAAVALFAQPGQEFPASAVDFVLYATFHLTIGISILWLYAAIRPRYGAGPRTALRAGFAGWWLAFAVQIPFQGSFMLFRSSQIGWSVMAVFAASAVLYSVAAVAGGAVYREAEPAAVAAMATHG